MEGTNTTKRRLKLKKNSVAENKCDLKRKELYNIFSFSTFYMHKHFLI